MKTSTTIKQALLVAIIASCLVVSAENKSPRMGNGLYQIGGGEIPLPPTTIRTVRSQNIGASWDDNVACGELDPQITISNQLNGVTQGFKNMMGNIISSATSAVASLPGLALQKASPELYDMLQQGVLQGKMDFEYAETSCEEMQRVIAGNESFPFEKYKLSASAADWAFEIGNTGGDAVLAKDNLDSTIPGDKGTDWACSSTRGGIAQPPITTIRDVVIVGYNIMFDRTDSCSTGTVPLAMAVDSPLQSYWIGPIQAANWAVSVVGDIEIRTCDGCKKLTGIPGKGLVYKHRLMTEDIRDSLIDLVDGTVSLTWANLRAISALPGVIVKGPVITSIRKRTANNRLFLINNVAGELAYLRIIEQAKLTTRMLMTGIKEPNMANHEDAVKIVFQAIDQLQIELDQLQLEIKSRVDIAGGTIQQLLLLDEKNIQDTDPVYRNSLNATNKLGNTEQ